MRARAAAIAAALFFCHHVMTKGGKYHPPLLFSFCSQYKSKKISPGMTFWLLCTKCTCARDFGHGVPLCIFQNLFIIIVLMQMIISQTKDFAQTNGYLSNKRRAQSRRGDIAAATPLQRWYVIHSIVRNPNDGAQFVRLYAIHNIDSLPERI